MLSIFTPVALFVGVYPRGTNSRKPPHSGLRSGSGTVTVTCPDTCAARSGMATTRSARVKDTTHRTSIFPRIRRRVTMIVRLTSESRQDPAGVEDAGVVDQEPGAAVPPGDAQDLARRVLDEASTRRRRPLRAAAGGLKTRPASRTPAWWIKSPARRCRRETLTTVPSRSPEGARTVTALAVVLHIPLIPRRSGESLLPPDSPLTVKKHKIIVHH